MTFALCKKQFFLICISKLRTKCNELKQRVGKLTAISFILTTSDANVSTETFWPCFPFTASGNQIIVHKMLNELCVQLVTLQDKILQICGLIRSQSRGILICHKTIVLHSIIKCWQILIDIQDITVLTKQEIYTHMYMHACMSLIKQLHNNCCSANIISLETPKL